MLDNKCTMRCLRRKNLFSGRLMEVFCLLPCPAAERTLIGGYYAILAAPGPRCKFHTDRDPIQMIIRDLRPGIIAYLTIIGIQTACCTGIRSRREFRTEQRRMTMEISLFRPDLAAGFTAECNDNAVLTAFSTILQLTSNLFERAMHDILCGTHHDLLQQFFAAVHFHDLFSISGTAILIRIYIPIVFFKPQAAAFDRASINAALLFRIPFIPEITIRIPEQKIIHLSARTIGMKQFKAAMSSLCFKNDLLQIEMPIERLLAEIPAGVAVLCDDHPVLASLSPGKQHACRNQISVDHFLRDDLSFSDQLSVHICAELNNNVCNAAVLVLICCLRTEYNGNAAAILAIHHLASELLIPTAAHKPAMIGIQKVTTALPADTVLINVPEDPRGAVNMSNVCLGNDLLDRPFMLGRRDRVAFFDCTAYGTDIRRIAVLGTGRSDGRSGRIIMDTALSTNRAEPVLDLMRTRSRGTCRTANRADLPLAAGRFGNIPAMALGGNDLTRILIAAHRTRIDRDAVFRTSRWRCARTIIMSQRLQNVCLRISAARIRTGTHLFAALRAGRGIQNRFAESMSKRGNGLRFLRTAHLANACTTAVLDTGSRNLNGIVPVGTQCGRSRRTHIITAFVFAPIGKAAGLRAGSLLNFGSSQLMARCRKDFFFKHFTAAGTVGDGITILRAGRRLSAHTFIPMSVIFAHLSRRILTDGIIGEVRRPERDIAVRVGTLDLGRLPFVIDIDDVDGIDIIPGLQRIRQRDGNRSVKLRHILRAVGQRDAVNLFILFCPGDFIAGHDFRR